MPLKVRAQKILSGLIELDYGDNELFKVTFIFFSSLVEANGHFEGSHGLLQHMLKLKVLNT